VNEIINVEIPFPLFPIVSGCKTRHAIPSIQSFPIISSVLPLESHAARSRSSPGFSILYYPFLQRAGGERAGCHSVHFTQAERPERISYPPSPTSLRSEDKRKYNNVIHTRIESQLHLRNIENLGFKLPGNLKGFIYRILIL